MSRIPTTADLVQEIREQADELNQAAKSDDAIVRSMNRGLKYMTSCLARHWDSLLVARTVYPPGDYSVDEGYDIPTDCFEGRITYVQVDTPAAPTDIHMREYSQVSSLNIKSSRSFVPVAAYQRGLQLYLVPTPGGAYNIIVYYVRIPDPLVLPIGRVNVASGANNYVVLDSSANMSCVSTNSDDRTSYVNIVDQLTGVIKYTMQVARVDGTKLTFRATPTRSVVEGYEVDTEFTDSTEPVTEVPPPFIVSPDDWVCPVDGTCVLQLGQAFNRYIVDYAVSELGRSLAEQMTQINEAILKSAAQQAKSQRAGRPQTMRVKNRSKVWGVIRPSAYPYVPS